MDRCAALLQLAQARSPKRGRRERVAVHSWHPYYAGYSQAFVEDTLRAFSPTKDFLLVDPWNGSGTTTLTAQQMGVRSIGIEVNPVMVIFAKAKALTLAGGTSHIAEMAQVVTGSARASLKDVPSRGCLAGWVPDPTLVAILSLLESILHDPRETFGYSELAITDNSLVIPRPYYSETTSFLLAALFQVLRKVGSFGSGSNPTWVRKKDAEAVTDPEDVIRMFTSTVHQMQGDLAALVPPEKDVPLMQVYEGDSRSLPLADSSVDGIITSPPYCTRIDYAVSTKPELLLLGFAENDEIDALRRSTMGAPVIVDKTLRPRNEWGERCLTMLQQVLSHPAKASKSYYYPNLLQYFRDAEESMRQLLRVLKPGGFAAIVVQSSFYKEIEIPLGEIYVQLATALGAHAEIARREVVRQHMAHVNLTSENYKADKVFYEDVVLVQKGLG